MTIQEYCKDAGITIERLNNLVEADQADQLIILSDTTYADVDGESALRSATYTFRPTVKTTLGDIVVDIGTDPDNPGVWISLHRDGDDYEPTLALVECTSDEIECDRPVIITRVWGDADQEDYTTRIVHSGLN